MRVLLDKVDLQRYSFHLPLFRQSLAILSWAVSHYRNWSKDEEAEPLLQRALAIYEKVLGSEHPETVRLKENYSNLLQQIKRRQEQQGQK
jgi:hypothetical protein